MDGSEHYPLSVFGNEDLLHFTILQIVKVTNDILRPPYEVINNSRRTLPCHESMLPCGQ